MKPPSLASVISVFAFFIILLLAWFTVGAFGFYHAVASNFWPTTAGRIVSARVQSPSGKATKYIAEITFAYTVGGKEYTSDRYKATAARGTSSWARELIAQHPVNSEVTVHYDPKNPEEAIVEPGLQSDDYIMTFVPLGMVFLLAKVLRKQINDSKERGGSPTSSTQEDQP